MLPICKSKGYILLSEPSLSTLEVPEAEFYKKRRSWAGLILSAPT